MITTALPFVLGTIFALWFPLWLVLSVRNLRTTQPATWHAGARDRLALLDVLVTALLGVLFSWLFMPWDVVPPLLWAVPVALTVYGALHAASAWTVLPWVARGRRVWLAAAGTAISAAIAGAAAWLVLA